MNYIKNMPNIGCKKCKQKEYKVIRKITIAEGKIELRLCTTCFHTYRIIIDATGGETYYFC